MTKYHVIQPDGSVTSEEWTGQTEYLCVPFADIRRLLGFRPEEMLEHVSVLWQGKRAHMFVDENGRTHALQLNPKATRVYWNATCSRIRDLQPLVYSDLSQDPYIRPNPALADRLHTEGLYGSVIVGPALLWEGEME